MGKNHFLIKKLFNYLSLELEVQISNENIFPSRIIYKTKILFDTTGPIILGKTLISKKKKSKSQHKRLINYLQMDFLSFYLEL